MTMNEALEALANVNCADSDITKSFSQLFQIVLMYDGKLNWLFSNFLSPAEAHRYASSFAFNTLCGIVVHCYQHNGLYHLRGDGNLEDVDNSTLIQLRADIVSEIIKSPPESSDNSESEENSEDKVIWVEEDDDFLTRKNK